MGTFYGVIGSVSATWLVGWIADVSAVFVDAHGGVGDVVRYRVERG